MRGLYHSVDQLIGNTPVMMLDRIVQKLGLKANIAAKLEYLNPAGSAKDRIAKAMIDQAEAEGILKPGGTIIEPTSGNTGIGLCAVGVPRGYRVIIVMPEDMSEERRKLIKAYGGELVLTSAAGSLPEALAKVDELHRSIPGSIIAGQFINPANPGIHYEETARELWEDADGQIDVFVAGMGTGGTITGTARYLKEQKPDIRIVAMEPENAAVLHGEESGPHKIQGIGDGFVPDVMDPGLVDEMLKISDDEALEYARMVSQTEGLLVGISSGGYLAAAVRLARRPENEGKTIATVFMDSGMRYFSTELFD
jgi:cysteine synthase A